MTIKIEDNIDDLTAINKDKLNRSNVINFNEIKAIGDFIEEIKKELEKE